ncbi:carbohydrate-binding module family 12 protein [Peniophora sp. CONT]|nr:carbohydrate-binding module family 12 protein [Peniophora sp. CONT]
MTNYWEPGTQYNNGDIVEYIGHRYKIIQPHHSQSDWTPDVTPALWGRLQDGDHGFGGGEYRAPEHHAENPPQYGYGQEKPAQQPVYQPPAEQTTQIQHEEKKKNWWDLDEDRKKELLVGGGLLGAAGLLAGGFYAYKKHEKNEEEEKALQFGLQKWLEDAQRRRDEFYSRGPRAPTTWVLTEKHDIPDGALPAGRDGEGNPIYVARAFHEGGVHVGHVSRNTKQGAVISFGGDDFEVTTYEILLGDERAVHWEHLRGRFVPQNLYNSPVDGGHEANGTPIAVARAEKDGWIIPGKASANVEGANIAHHGKEKRVEDYEVLCYNKQAGF